MKSIQNVFTDIDTRKCKYQTLKYRTSRVDTNNKQLTSRSKALASVIKFTS